MQCSKFLAVLVLVSNAALAQLLSRGEVQFSGDVLGPRDLSAVQRVGEFLAIASDEGTVMQLLRAVDETHYSVAESYSLLPDGSGEIDMEALASDGNTLYVLGSHSRARKPVQGRYSRAENRLRLLQVELEPARDKLFRFNLDLQTGRRSSDIESASLRPLVDNHALLGLFANTPGKENGVDFEGMAVVDGRLYLALRGPVLRGNYVPVLSMKFEDVGACAAQFDALAARCRLLYLRLGGRGVRSLHRVEEGFLVLAGPVGDADASYQLYFWDGRDCLPDERESACRLQNLGDVPLKPSSGPEGLAVLAEHGTTKRIMIVYDGAERGAPALFEVTVPGAREAAIGGAH